MDTNYKLLCKLKISHYSKTALGTISKPFALHSEDQTAPENAVCYYVEKRFFNENFNCMHRVERPISCISHLYIATTSQE